jgi:hypothetical protein
MECTLPIRRIIDDSIGLTEAPAVIGWGLFLCCQRSFPVLTLRRTGLSEQANFVRLANAEAYKSTSMQNDPATTLFVFLA